MFRIKICGITNRDDALLVADAGGDAIGLNFYASSPRVCQAEAAREIVAALPGHVCKVGVFVNATEADVRDACKTFQLDLVQLHGDETPEYLSRLRGIPVMKAFRVRDDFTLVAKFLRECHALRCLPRMVLVDAHQAGEFGGTGATADWRGLAAARAHFAGLPLVLAGGLKPSNVAEAIVAVRPWAVDTASGVEASPGKKCANLVREFIAAARDEFARQNAAR